MHKNVRYLFNRLRNPYKNGGKGIYGIDYMHIPKWAWLLKVVKAVLPVERVRGRGRNYKALWLDRKKINSWYLNRDGHVPMKYASYIYVKLAFRASVYRDNAVKVVWFPKKRR